MGWPPGKKKTTVSFMGTNCLKIDIHVYIFQRKLSQIATDTKFANVFCVKETPYNMLFQLRMKCN